MKNPRKVFQALTMILQFGLNMIVPIAICMALGIWLDKKYDMPSATSVNITNQSQFTTYCFLPGPLQDLQAFIKWRSRS